ncbi:hypothetical protein LTR53_010376, partial [Teratosphaeriaceae sp. CCFEE 6253]
QYLCYDTGCEDPSSQTYDGEVDQCDATGGVAHPSGKRYSCFRESPNDVETLVCECRSPDIASSAAGSSSTISTRAGNANGYSTTTIPGDSTSSSTGTPTLSGSSVAGSTTTPSSAAAQTSGASTKTGSAKLGNLLALLAFSYHLTM